MAEKKNFPSSQGTEVNKILHAIQVLCLLKNKKKKKKKKKKRRRRRKRKKRKIMKGSGARLYDDVWIDFLRPPHNTTTARVKAPAHPSHKNEEETDKTKHAPIEQTYEKHKD